MVPRLRASPRHGGAWRNSEILYSVNPAAGTRLFGTAMFISYRDNEQCKPSLPKKRDCTLFEIDRYPCQTNFPRFSCPVLFNLFSSFHKYKHGFPGTVKKSQARFADTQFCYS